MAGLVCPHCGMVLPLTGAGSKAIIKVRGAVKPLKDPNAESPPPKEKPLDILGSFYEGWWYLAQQFGYAKNFKASESAKAYLHLIQNGWPVELIKVQTERYIRLTDEKKYLKQMIVWLESLAETPPTDEESDAASRLHARDRAE